MQLSGSSLYISYVIHQFGCISKLEYFNFDLFNYDVGMAKLKLDQILKQKKMSKYKLAQILGLPTASIFRYFKPEYDPKLSTLEKWAKVLGVRIRDLYEE